MSKSGTASVLIGFIMMASASSVPETVVESQVVVREVVDETEVERLEAEVVALEAEVNQLNTHRSNLREWNRNLQSRVFARNRAIASLEDRLEAEGLTLAEQDEQWLAGYAFAGGTNPTLFTGTILPCESGNGANAHEALGDQTLGTSRGRAQIHRPSWRAAFNSITGQEFDTHITEPALNGAMAAVVEREHPSGLNAWTCFRNRK